MRVSNRRTKLAAAAAKLSREDQIELASTILDGIAATAQNAEGTPTVISMAANLAASENVDAKLFIEYGTDDRSVFDTTQYSLHSDASEDGYRTIFIPALTSHDASVLLDA